MTGLLEWPSRYGFRGYRSGLLLGKGFAVIGVAFLERGNTLPGERIPRVAISTVPDPLKIRSGRDTHAVGVAAAFAAVAIIKGTPS